MRYQTIYMLNTQQRGSKKRRQKIKSCHKLNSNWPKGPLLRADWAKQTQVVSPFFFLGGAWRGKQALVRAKKYQQWFPCDSRFSLVFFFVSLSLSTCQRSMQKYSFANRANCHGEWFGRGWFGAWNWRRRSPTCVNLYIFHQFCMVLLCLKSKHTVLTFWVAQQTTNRPTDTRQLVDSVKTNVEV